MMVCGGFQTCTIMFCPSILFHVGNLVQIIPVCYLPLSAVLGFLYQPSTANCCDAPGNSIVLAWSCFLMEDQAQVAH